MAQNVMVATVQGDIYYLRNGRVPIRAPGVDPSRPVPGHTSKNEWQGIHPLSDLVQVTNPPGGWMQNCNCSPAAMMFDSPMTPGQVPGPPVPVQRRNRTDPPARPDDERGAGRRRPGDDPPGDRHRVQRRASIAPSAGRAGSRRRGPAPRSRPDRATRPRSSSRSTAGIAAATPTRPAPWRTTPSSGRWAMSRGRRSSPPPV